jgi:hypothetical protein
VSHYRSVTWTLFDVYTHEQRSTGNFFKDMTGDR